MKDYLSLNEILNFCFIYICQYHIGRLQFGKEFSWVTFLFFFSQTTDADPGTTRAAAAWEKGGGMSGGQAGGWTEEQPAVGSRWRWSAPQRQHRESHRYFSAHFPTRLRCSHASKRAFLLLSRPETDAQAEWRGLQQPQAVEPKKKRPCRPPGGGPSAQRESLR